MTEALARVLAALLQPFADPESRTWWPALLGAALLALLWEARRDSGPGLLSRALGWRRWAEPSSRLDLQLLAARQLLRLLTPLRALSSLGLAASLALALEGALGRPPSPALPAPALAGLYSLSLFLAGDASRFLVHRACHRLPWLWAFHQVHHSAELLTPLTFHRLHPVEALLLQLRGLLVTGLVGGLFGWLWRGEAVAWTILGVEAIGFCLNALVGNLRHSHIWMPFPARVERWLLSPAQHQRHHSASPLERESNYGTWLALWDRLAGSWRAAGPHPPAAFGLPMSTPRPAQELWPALMQPFAHSARALARRWPLAGLALLLPSPALSAEPDAVEDTDESGDVGEIIITSERGLPLVGGAAFELGQEELERQEQDDIHKLLIQVPGVYVRDEEGHGLRPNIGMRGAASERSSKITLLEDGLPIAPAPYAAPSAYYFPLTTRMVGLEVFKGAAAIAHGPQTIGGAVNLLTRPVPAEEQGEVDLAAGSYGTLKAHAWGGGRRGPAGLLLEAAHLGSEGFKELDTGGPTGFSRQDLMAKGLLRLPGGERQELQLKLGYGRERSYETYLGLSLDDARSTPYRRYAASDQDEMRWTQQSASLTWCLLQGGLSLHGAAYAFHLDRTWHKLNGFAGGADIHDLLVSGAAGQAATYEAILKGEEDSATTDQVLLIGDNHRVYTHYGVQLGAQHYAEGERLKNHAELGLRLHADRVDRLHTEDAYDMRSGVLVPRGGPTETTFDAQHTADAVALFARDSLTWGPLTLAPGLRHERVTTSAIDEAEPAQPAQERSIWLPGASLALQPLDWGMAFAGLHRGYSPAPPGADPEEAPETAWNAEAGLRLAPASTQAELVGYGSLYDNIQGTCTLSSGCADTATDTPYNGGEARVAGMEAALRQQVELPRDLRLEASAAYTYTWSAFQTGFVSDFPLWGEVSAGDRLPYVPEHQGSAGLTLLHDRGSIGLHSALRGPMRDLAGQGPIPEAERIPASATLDLQAAWRPRPALQLYAALRNATGQAQISSLRPYGALVEPPRTLLCGLKLAPPASADPT